MKPFIYKSLSWLVSLFSFWYLTRGAFKKITLYHMNNSVDCFAVLLAKLGSTGTLLHSFYTNTELILFPIQI